MTDSKFHSYSTFTVSPAGRAQTAERGLQRRNLEEFPYVGIDEKSFRKRQNYVAVLNDLSEGRVLEVVEGRTTLTNGRGDLLQLRVGWGVEETETM